MPVLATKLFRPPLPPKIVLRPRLVERLNAGLQRKLTLVSAAAGFGKTTLLSEWLAGLAPDPAPLGSGEGINAAWLSLDERDGDPARFLTYFVAALQTISPATGQGVLAALQSPQPPPAEALLTALLNDVAAVTDHFILVLDDYHLVDAPPVDQALAFLLEHLPPRMHLVIATREDPNLPLARLRASGQLTELRVAELRFTPAEAAEFLNQVIQLNLSAEDIAALETRTEGWIAGLQMAALALQGTASLPEGPDAASFIKSFTGSHRFVLDYLMEEVLQQQPESLQAFLLRTSILERLCGPLCDAVLGGGSASGQATLETIERLNLFIVPLDNQRRWYRYHHLFADLLRQRLVQSVAAARGAGGASVAEYHVRASAWYEDNGLEIEAFQHAVAANDIERAARLVEGNGMPLPFRGAAVPVLRWLESLPQAVLDAHPAQWVIYASALLFVSKIAEVEAKLQAAEAVLPAEPSDEKTRDLIGHIASIRATLAVTQHQAKVILAQSRRALEYLQPANLPVRTATTWTLGYAYQLQGDRQAARQAYTEALAASQSIGHFIIILMTSLGLGSLQESDLQLSLAAESYRRALQLAGDPPLPVACGGYLGLARIYYEWNDLESARQSGDKGIQLAQQLENIDRAVSGQVFLARLQLARGEAAEAAALLDRAEQSARRQNFALQLPEIAAARVQVLLRQGDLEAAARLAQAGDLPLSQARVELARGDPAAASARLEPLRQQMEARGWQAELLQTLLLLALARRAQGDKDSALHLLEQALALAEPGSMVRSFIDEGAPMAQLLAEAAAQEMRPGYTGKLLAAFAGEAPGGANNSGLPAAQPLVDPLSPRELEILRLIAQGRSNREIAGELFLALDTVKGHNQKIFDKLQVQRRTEAVARARQLGLL